MNKRFSLFVLMILLAAMLSAASIISSPAATVNLIRNTAITMQDLDEEMARYEALGIQGVNKTDVLQTLINNEVFLQGAERDGISISDRQIDSLYAQAKANIEAQAGMAISDAEFEAEVIRQFGTVEAYRESLKNQMIVQQYLMQEKSAELQNVPAPEESAISSFYRQNQQRFFQPENTFEKAVIDYSQDTGSNQRGGDIGWLTADNTVARQGWGDAFCDAVLSMEPGEVSGVLESNTGYHIVKVSVHNQAKLLGINDPVSPEDSATVHDFIYNMLYMQNQQVVMNRALESLIAELRAEAQINILYRG